MISLRQLLIVALVAAGIWLFKRLQDRIAAAPRRVQNQDQPTTPEVDYQEMVLCNRCGVHIPQAEATKASHNKFLCVDKKACVQRSNSTYEQAG